MKTNLRLFSAMAAIFLSISSFANTETQFVDGIEWTYAVSNGKASIGNVIRYTIVGDLVCASAIPISTSGALTIPSMLGGYPVTSIGYHAFYGCSGLTSITIPDSVTDIGDSAFADCSGLTSITIPDGVTSIGSSAFYGCSAELYDTNTIPGVCLVDGWAVGHAERLPLVLNLEGIRGIGASAFADCSVLTSVTIPDGVTSIGVSAFYSCSALTSVAIPNSVTSIGDHAFENSGLTSITIPNNVTHIGAYAFGDCSELMSVTIGSSVTSIGDHAFIWCSSLTSISIPDSVTNIGFWVFYDCYKLRTVEIGDGLIHIDPHTFEFCSGLLSFSVSENNPMYSSNNGLLLSKDGKTLVEGVNGFAVRIPNSVTNIGCEAFYGRSGLMSIMIPNSVTNIENNAFSYCSGLTSVTIPDSVTNIDDCAFFQCSGLQSVGIPDSVTSIGASAFEDCSSLISITIPDSVTHIGEYAFCGCEGLKSITIPEAFSDQIWEWYLPYDCQIVLVKNSHVNIDGALIPKTWISEKAPSILAMADGNHRTAAKAKALNGRSVWECYVADLDPENPDDDLVADIEMIGGEPHVRILKGESDKRRYEIEGAPAPGGPWGERDETSRFFRIRVVEDF